MVKSSVLMSRIVGFCIATAVMLCLAVSVVSCKSNAQGSKAVPKQITPEQFKQGMDTSKMQKGAAGEPAAPAAEPGGQ